MEAPSKTQKLVYSVGCVVLKMRINFMLWLVLLAFEHVFASVHWECVYDGNGTFLAFE